MERNQAIELLKSTLNSPYDEHKFSNLAINFLNDLDSANATGVLSEDYLKPNFKNHILQYKRLGFYTDLKGESIDVLTVQLKNERSLERSRSMLRNFAADYIKNNSQGNAALVAYYTNNLEDWRFSYIRLDYSLEKSDSGKVKVREDLTPAKRYSYLVGLNEPNHIAQVQILPLLESDEKPTIDEIENAFKVDALSKLFYQDYRKLFEDLTKEIIRIIHSDSLIKIEFENKNIQPDNFAKRLMGQIVFLFFIQKKGWLGVGKDSDWGSGNKKYLQEEFEKNQSNNFYIDVLEPLFYEALATDRQGDYYSKLDCKIPFLSGGLFEPMNDFDWINVKVPIENQLIENILSKFDQYNFTVRESDPIEVDIAIDPEMLGRVFENLLPENIRRGKGAYYTPRTIVHYMCQESLINYLDTKCEKVPKNNLETLIREGDTILELETAVYKDRKKYQSVLLDYIKDNAQAVDDALASIKVCDPAIGSGAFAVGMLHEIVKARKVLELYLDKEETTYTLKRHCIQESIYGVDIDPGAIDIAKLRMWLSLVVDEEDFKNIQTLPNLDYKIMQGNSLIEEFHGISLDIEKKDKQQKDLFAGGSDLDALIDRLHQRQTDFFNAEHPNDKKKKREAVETAIYNVFHSELEKKRNISSIQAKEIESDLKEMTYGKKTRNFFPWKLYFADIFRENSGFDILIANPPYIKEYTDKNAFNGLKNKECYQGKMDIWYLFAALSIDILKKIGTLCFIATNQWIMNSGASKFRNKILKETQILDFVDFGDYKIFDSAGVQTMIMKLSKKNITKKYSVNYSKIINSKIKKRSLKSFLLKNISNNYIFFKAKINPDELDKPIFFISKENSLLLEKIQNKNNFTLLESEVAQGIVGAPDKAFIITSSEIENFNELEKKYLKRFYTSADRYYTKESSKCIFYFNRYNLKSIDGMGNVKEKLRPYMNKLKNRREVLSGQIKYFHLQWPRNEAFFRTGNKIICATRTDKPSCTFTKESFYASRALNIILTDRISNHILTALLNSKLSHYWFKYKGKLTGNLLQIDKNQLLTFPISNIGRIEEELISSYINEIISIKQNNVNANIFNLENKIDQLVYKLYDLTVEEIQKVESSVG